MYAAGLRALLEQVRWVATQPTIHSTTHEPHLVGALEHERPPPMIRRRSQNAGLPRRVQRRAPTETLHDCLVMPLTVQNDSDDCIFGTTLSRNTTATQHLVHVQSY